MAKCGSKTEIYSRVVGYFRPVSDWNKGKQQEFTDRKVYQVKTIKQGDKEGNNMT